jgi:hypothetical protein
VEETIGANRYPVSVFVMSTIVIISIFNDVGTTSEAIRIQDRPYRFKRSDAKQQVGFAE